LLGNGFKRFAHYLYPKPINQEKMAKEILECSFCGRKKPETNLLIAGINAHICDKCIDQAHGIVLEELKQSKYSNLGRFDSVETKRNSCFFRSICYWTRSN
jgi:hypothetical protein